MKLILTSEFHCVADKLLAQWHLKTTKKKVAFIQNATDVRQDWGEVISRVEAPKQWYQLHWFQLDIIDLRIIQGSALKEKLAQYDYLHIHGWENLHLHKICNTSWLSHNIQTLLQDGLVYIGSSAGSIIAWPDIAHSLVNPTNPICEEDRGDNFKWFGLHPFYIIPHANQPEKFQAKIDRVQYCEDNGIAPYISFSNTQAIIIEDGKFEFIA